MFSLTYLSSLCARDLNSSVSTDTIPFELTSHNNLSIKAVINGSDTVDLMFHTAAHDISLIKATTDMVHTIKWDQAETVQSWGGESKSRFSRYNSLQIGSMRWDSLSIWENNNSGPETDGKFGPDLFNKKVIEIDFDQQHLLIHETLPQKAATYSMTPLSYENGFMFIVGSSTIGDHIYPNRFLIHTGYGRTILYDDHFIAQSQLGKHIEITEQQELKDSFGNILKTNKGILPLFGLGQDFFTDIPVGFFEGQIGRQKMSVIGGNLLKRLNIIIDANREYIYLKTNSLKELPY